MMSRVPVKATFNDVHIRIWKGLLKKRLSVARWAGENSNYAGM